MTDSDMYRRVGWMMPVDEAIMRLLSPPDSLELTPANIARNISYTTQYTGDRCRFLAEIGVLESTDGYYSLTELGEQVWNGELSEEKLDEIGPKKE